METLGEIVVLFRRMLNDLRGEVEAVKGEIHSPEAVERILDYLDSLQEGAGDMGKWEGIEDEIARLTYENETLKELLDPLMPHEDKIYNRIRYGISL